MMTLTTNDGDKEQEYCAGLGSCDFSTGQVWWCEGGVAGGAWFFGSLPVFFSCWCKVMMR